MPVAISGIAAMVCAFVCPLMYPQISICALRGRCALSAHDALSVIHNFLTRNRPACLSEINRMARNSVYDSQPSFLLKYRFGGAENGIRCLDL